VAPAMVHQVVQAIPATTPIFKSFFRQMDGTFGYPMDDFGKDGPGMQEHMDAFFANKTNMPR